ncbi:hypothetical protein JOQ06_006998 [Pogonophryne albipinna]|uniref:Uncharacterized protein n=1 Tax=Pogonophryne albipinna TaxID=1090488 RepID=A0AAD6FHT6_9TELE|nr:hypothetical protein JOQ06_006998 [Pogonophryne albipinna]
MTHQGHANFDLAPSMCEGHKEHDIWACDGGLVSQSLPPVIAVTGWTLLLSDMPCSAQAALGASHLSPFMSEEGESGAEVPEEEEEQTGKDSVALPGPAHSSVSTVSSLTD